MAITVNDIEYSWGSITLKIRGVEITGFKAVSYSDAVEREAVYGAGRHKLGMTRGKYTTEQGSLTAFLKQERAIIEEFGDGWADGDPFEVEVRYAEPGEDTHIDIVEGCRWAGTGGGGEEGSAPLEREMKFDYMRVKRDGKYLVALPTA